MISRIGLNIWISIKMLINNKLRLVLTITGMSLGLLLVVGGIEIINTYTENKYKKISYIDNNVVMLYSNNDIVLSEALYKLKSEKCEYSYNYYKKAIDLSTDGYWYKNSRIDYSLELLGASYDFQDGYICFDDNDSNYCGKINLLYGQGFSKTQYNDKENVCLIERSTSELIFGNENSIGEFIDVEINSYTYKFEVIGIIDDMPTTLTDNLNINSSIYTNSEVLTQRDVIVPLSWYDYFYKYAERSECYVMFCFSEKDAQLGSSILGNVGYKTDSVEIIDYNGSMKSLQEYTFFLKNVVSILLICLFMISGLIVMNTMIFSIKERISEIGIIANICARLHSKDFMYNNSSNHL